MRLEKYIPVRPTAAMIDIVVRLVVELISILGIATKEIGQGGYRMHFLTLRRYRRNLTSHAEKYVNKLLGIRRLEDAVQRLDKFTLEIQTIAARIDDGVIHVDRLRGVHTNIHSVVREVSFINTGDLFLSSLAPRSASSALLG